MSCARSMAADAGSANLLCMDAQQTSPPDPPLTLRAAPGTRRSDVGA
jgi:hypothetical protein